MAYSTCLFLGLLYTFLIVNLRSSDKTNIITVEILYTSVDDEIVFCCTTELMLVEHSCGVMCRGLLLC